MRSPTRSRSSITRIIFTAAKPGLQPPTGLLALGLCSSTPGGQSDPYNDGTQAR